MTTVLRFFWPDTSYRHPTWRGDRSWVEKFFVAQEHLMRLVLIVGSPLVWLLTARLFVNDVSEDCLYLDCGFVERAMPYIIPFGCVALFWWVFGYGYFVAKWYRTDPDKSTWLAGIVTAVLVVRHVRRR